MISKTSRNFSSSPTNACCLRYLASKQQLGFRTLYGPEFVDNLQGAGLREHRHFALEDFVPAPPGRSPSTPGSPSRYHHLASRVYQLHYVQFTLRHLLLLPRAEAPTKSAPLFFAHHQRFRQSSRGPTALKSTHTSKQAGYGEGCCLRSRDAAESTTFDGSLRFS